ncbi:nucleotide disphospho-sugar-binding domain-containing protein [Micromonospora olivasterospora]|uniref:UDP:flavonoid glycosyltransferase YjiC (YdhE family) n=1 Tax=Micromonospora olivasterospora TaxID=1880 RepID=A0A562I258_MICOL|nr:nucleotide disphospho-sugar-binding domain-containing protein [Micromonospora olivasterospora]TWH65117.1 UDP:flavonoid glycosyltransferase YjiC (YdhE family) [Micromonospora olivasterospora]
MRVLFVVVPGVGHLYPLVPLAWAFRAAGHDVLVAVAEHADRAAASGLTVVDPAPGLDLMAAMGQALRENPELAAVVQRPMRDPADWAAHFAAVNRPLVAGAVELARRWRPDLVLFDHACTAGLIAAAAAGAPAVQQILGVFRSRGLHERTAAHLADVWRPLGVTEVAPPVATLEYMPPGMMTGEPEGRFTRFVPYTGGGVLPDWLRRRPDRPRVAVTLGTIAPQRQGIGQLAPLVAAAAEVDAEFVLALGHLDPAPLGPLPPNVRAAGWVPLDPLLATCAAVVHHGGASTMLTAITHGVPQLVILAPGDTIRPLMGEALRRSGAGLVAGPAEVDAALIRRLLTDEGLRAATGRVRAENLALPTPADTVAWLEDLLVRQGTVDGSHAVLH